MSATLQQVQAELDARGVRDVKFYFNQEQSTLTDVKEKVAYFLSTYLRGDIEKAPAANDSKN